MKVLLTQTLERIGIVGEVVDVSDGFARNFLLPKKIAIQPTDGNIKRLEVVKLEYEKKQRDLREQKEKLLEALTGQEVTISRQANDEGHLFGSVSKRDIAEALQAKGFKIEPDDVRLDEPLRRVDTFNVPVQIAGDLRTDVKVWIVRDKAAATEGKPAEAAPESTPETHDDEEGA